LPRNIAAKKQRNGGSGAYRGPSRLPERHGPDRLEFAFAPVAASFRKEFRYLTRNGFAYLTL